MAQYLDEAGLEALWKKIKKRTPIYDPKTVAEKNTVLKEQDITSMYNDGSLFENISNGTFDDINPGNYFNATVNNLSGTATNFTFVVLELDRYYGRSDNTGTSKTQHHIVVTPKGSTSFGTAVMNSSSTNAGGYLGSAMFKTTIPSVDTALTNTFGDHLKTVSLNLSNVGYTQKPYSYVNTIVKSYLFTEYEVFGKITYDDENYTSYNQYAAFKLSSSLIATNSWYWERSVLNLSGYFCDVDYSGAASFIGASRSGGVRPGFLIG